MHALRRGATREVSVSNTVKVGGMRSDKQLQDFSMFGTVEKVRAHWDRNFAFVSFTDIASATAAVQGIKAAKPEYALYRCRVDYAYKDRCARPLTSASNTNTSTNTPRVQSEAQRAPRRAFKPRNKASKRAAREAALATHEAEVAGESIKVQDA